METVKEDHGAEFATHGGGEGTEDLVLTIPSGCEFLSWKPTDRLLLVGRVSSHCLRKREKHSTKWPASNKLLGQHFAKNCKQATAYTSHINYAKLLIQ